MKSEQVLRWLCGLFVLVASSVAGADLLINEILFNPPVADSTNECIELRGTPNSLLPAGTFLLNIEGDADGNPGTIQDMFDLSGLRVGQNGYLVLLQKNHRYTPNPLATVVTNSDNGDGWGSGSSSSLGHRGEGGQTELENPSCTFLLVETRNPPSIGDDLDQDDDGELDPTAIGDWLIHDAVGVLDNDGAGDRAYGRINFRRDKSPGNAGSTPAGSTVVSVPFTAGYLGRNGDSNGWDRTHWVASDNLGGAPPRWLLGANSSTTKTTNTYPPLRSRATLNSLGGPNFRAKPPPAVLIKESSNSTIVVEGGLKDSYTINLARTPFGAVTTRVDAAYPLQISTDGRTFTNSRTLVFTTTASKRITVRVPDDRMAGPSPLRALITHTVIGTRDPVQYPTNTIILPVSVSVYENDPVILSEAKVNPPGVDFPYEYIELRGSPGMIITNLHVLAVKGEADDAGEIAYSMNLTGRAFGTNGLLVLVSPGHPYAFGPGTTVIESLAPGGTEGVLDNDSLSLLLVGSAASIPQGVDLDGGDNGILEGLPADAVIMDAVGWTDDEVGAVLYGGVNLSQHFTPDAASRLPGNTVPLSAAAWMVGDLAGSTGDSAEFDLFNVSSNLPPGSILSPGTVNRTAPRISRLAPLSHVIGDPANPTVTFTVSDEETPVSSLVVTAVSTNELVVPNTNLTLKRITGGKYTLDMEPVGVGYSDILIRVNDGTFIGIGVLHYAASLPGRSNTVWLTHVSDASTAIPIDSNWMLVGDDETQILRVYNRTHSGPPVKNFDINPFLALTDLYEDGTPKEVDIEGSTRVGNRLFWIGSHSHSAETLERTNRARLFATDLSGSGSNIAIRVVGHYDFLKLDLLDWDARNLHGKGADYYGLSASGAVGVDPKSPDGSGFNIEGLCMAPGSTTTAYVGFRAPLQPPPTNRVTALIVPILNFTTLAASGGAPGSAVFGTPIELNLGGRGIRSIEGVGTNYLIVAGPPGGGTNLPSPANFRLFTWSGKPTDAPLERAADLAGLNVEGIVSVPSGVWTTNTQFQLISDNGTTVYYGDDKEAKHLRIREFKKCRVDTVKLGAIVSPAPLMRAVRLNAGAAKLIWVAEPGTRYQVQCTFSLGQPVWTNLGGEVIADGPLTSLTVPTANPQCFYRVVIIP